MLCALDYKTLYRHLKQIFSYQKIYKEVQNSNDGIPTESAPAGFKEPHPKTPHNYHLEKIKRGKLTVIPRDAKVSNQQQKKVLIKGLLILLYWCT